MLSKLNTLKSKNGLGRSMLNFRQIYSWGSGRSFSSVPKDHEIFKIEADPYLYLDLYKNEFQQKVWADKLKIPPEFVHMYFGVIQRLRDASGDKANTFNPKKFDYDTPKTVVVEYLKSVEEDLMKTYLKYSEKEDLTLEQIIEIEGIRAPKPVEGVSLKPEFKKDQVTESEKLQIQNEKDVFEMKLNSDEQALVDKIISNFSENFPANERNNPNRIKGYKTQVLKGEDGQLISYIIGDRLIKTNSLLSPAKIEEISQMKGQVLSYLNAIKSEDYKKVEHDRKLFESRVSQLKLERIMEKRQNLKSKLKMLEDIHKVYAQNTLNVPEHFKLNSMQILGVLEKKGVSEPVAKVSKFYEGNNPEMIQLETNILKVQNGENDPNLINETYRLLDAKNDTNYNHTLFKMKFGVAVNNDAYAQSAFQTYFTKMSSHNPNFSQTLPYDVFKDLFTLFLKNDNFKGLGQLVKYAEQRKLYRYSSLDLSGFKPSLEYYVNHEFKLSNVLVFMKFYAFRQKCLFTELNLTPESLRTLPVEQLKEVSNFLFPHSDLADLRSIFGYVVKRVGSNKILDSVTTQKGKKVTGGDVIENLIDYFVKFTVPFMNMPQFANNFILDKDVAKYYSNRFDERDNFSKVMKVSEMYEQNGTFQEQMIEQLNNFRSNNYNRLPSSYSAENVRNYIKSSNAGNLPDKPLELLMYVMQCNKMVPEMIKLAENRHLRFSHFITEAICNQANDAAKTSGTPQISEQVKKLFETKEAKQSELYTVCMMKALLKEGDTAAALRVLDEGERAQLGKKAAIEKYYINIFDHCFSQTSENQTQVSFFPDLLKEREERINLELAHASQISAYEHEKLKKKYKNVDLSKHMPVSFTEFKKRHFGMVKTMKNNMQQMILMKMVRSAIKNSDYENIDKLFTYLMVNKEEQELRLSARNQIEAYSRIYKPGKKVESLKQAEDPLRVLFEYVRKPYDNLETLTLKYLLMVPELKEKLDKLQKRKKFLHKEIAHLIREDDAKFLSEPLKDIQQYANIDQLQELGFELDNDQALGAMNEIINRFDKMTGPIDMIEEQFGLTEKEITTARQIRILDPKTNYEQICFMVKSAKGTSFEDRPEHILAELTNVKNNKKISQEFVKKYQSDSLSSHIKKSHIDSLLSTLKTHQNTLATPDDQFNVFETDLASHLHAHSSKPGKTVFEGANGQKVEIDEERLFRSINTLNGAENISDEDACYFTEVVGELAKGSVEQIIQNQQNEFQEGKKLTAAVMKSREFRRFYYFTRRFFFEKLLRDAKAGIVKMDENGNISFTANFKPFKPENLQISETDDLETILQNNRDLILKESGNKDGNFGDKYNIFDDLNDFESAEDAIMHIFQPPKFDIANFKKYFPPEEYMELVQEFGKYTKGQNDKSAFIKSRLLSSLPDSQKSEVGEKISNKLRMLFDRSGTKVSRDAQPSQVLGMATPEELAPLNASQAAELDMQRQYQNLYKNDLRDEWLRYKNRKINEYLASQRQAPVNLTETVDFNILDDRQVEQRMKEIDQISDLITLAEIQQRPAHDVKVSEDHLAFQFFDNLSQMTDFEYTEYEDSLHRLIYGEDNFEKGYTNQMDMADKFKDVLPLRTRTKSENEFHLAARMGEKPRVKTTDGGSSEFLKDDPYYGDRQLQNENSEVETELGKNRTNNHEFARKIRTNFKTIDADMRTEVKKSENPHEARFMKSQKDTDYDKILMNIPMFDDYMTPAYMQQKEMELHKKFTLPGKSNEPHTDYVRKEKAYNESLSKMKWKLEKAIKEQKEECLELAVAVFDKLSKIEMKHGNLQTLDSQNLNFSELDISTSDTREKLELELEKLKTTLRDETSPSLNYIQENMQYYDPKKFDGYDAKKYAEISEKLDEIYTELEQKEKSMIELQNAYEVLATQKPSTFSDSIFNKGKNTYESGYNSEILEGKVNSGTGHDAKELFEAYIEYQRTLLKEADASQSDSSSAVNLPDEHKINMIRSIFGVVEPGRINNFGTDLLEFGLTHDIPDAVRIGESLVGMDYIENANVSDALLKRLKAYKLKNSDKLRERIQHTGPMKSVIQRRKEHLMREQDRTGYLPSNFHELSEKYNDKYNRWRLPSIYAQDHKKYGVIGEILGEKRLDKLFKQ